MPSRFDYIAYDSLSKGRQLTFKEECQELEAHIAGLPDSREKSLALTKLEECYMWIGKAIRDEQLARTLESPLQEERRDS